MKKGHKCKHLYLLQIRKGGRRYRCCDRLGGFMLKHWRCVGDDSAECPRKKDGGLQESG